MKFLWFVFVFFFMRINLYGSEDISRLCLCFPLHPSCHIESAAVTSATWGPLQSHVPHFHPQRWSHMFVKMCMLCAFSSPICSHLFFSNEPRSPRGSKPKPHAIYTGRTAGALPAKAWEGDGPGEGERNYHGNFRLNQALAILFFCPLFSVSTSSTASFVFFSWVSSVSWSGPGHVGSSQLPGQTSLSRLNPISSSIPLFISLSISVSFHSLCCRCFRSLKHTFFPRSQWKSWTVLDGVRKRPFSLQLHLSTFCSFVMPDKADLLLQNWAFCVSSLFFSPLSSVAPAVPVLLWTIKSLPSTLSVCPVLSCPHCLSLDSSAVPVHLHLMWSPQQGRNSWVPFWFVYSRPSFIVPVELMRGEEKLTLIAAGDR